MRGKSKVKAEKYDKYIGKNPSDFISFADKIVCARIKLGLTQETAAKKIKISLAYLCRMEKGQRTSPKELVVDSMEKILNFRSGELIKSLKAAIK